MATLPTELFGQVLVIHTPETLSASASALLTETLRPRIDAGIRRFVLQMDQTQHWDSKGLTALLDARDSLRAVGGELHLAQLSPLGHKILSMTRLESQFEHYSSVVEAVLGF